MSIKIDWRRELLSAAEKMAEDLLDAKTDYDKLLVAARYGNIALAEQLLSNGVSINPNPDDFVTTPLYAAVASKKLQMVEFLVQHGADVNQKSRSNGDNTCLNVSILYRSFEIFNYLLERGAKVNTKSGHNDTALHEAAYLAQYHFDLAEKFIKKLLASGADVTAEFLRHKPQEHAIFHIQNNILLKEEEKRQRIEKINNLFSPVKVLESTQIAGLLKYSVVCTGNSEPTNKDNEDDYVLIDIDSLKDEQNQQSSCALM